LIARWRNIQSRLRQSGMNAGNQCQYDKQRAEFGFHKKSRFVALVSIKN
jgi:hypothetical protein